MREAYPATCKPGGDFKLRGSVSQIDPDLGFGRFRPAKRIEEKQSWFGAPGRVDDEFRWQSFLATVGAFVADGRNPVQIVFRDEFRDARARSYFNVYLLPQSLAANKFEQRSRQRKGFEAEVSLRIRVVSRPLKQNVECDPRLQRASRYKVRVDFRKQFCQGDQATGQEIMRVRRLRRAGAWYRLIREVIAIEYNDAVKVGRNGFRRRKAADFSTDDDSLAKHNGCLLGMCELINGAVGNLSPR